MSATFKQSNDNLQRYMAYTQDGLSDIFMGLAVLFAGLMLLSDMPWLAGIFPAVLLPALQSGKRSLISARVPSENLPESRSTSLKRFKLSLLLGLTVLLLLGVLLFVLISNDIAPAWLTSWLHNAMWPVIGGLFLLILAVVGVINRTPRYHLYAALTLLAWTIVALLSAPITWALILPGALITAGGLIVLWRFLQNHPRLDT